MKTLYPLHHVYGREKASLELEDFCALLLQKVFIRLQQVFVDKQAYINNTSSPSLPLAVVFLHESKLTLLSGTYKLAEPKRMHRPLKGQHVTCFQIMIFLGVYAM